MAQERNERINNKRGSTIQELSNQKTAENRAQRPAKKMSRRQVRKMPRKVGANKGRGALARTKLSKVQLSLIILGIVLAAILIASFYYMYNIARKSSRAIADNNVITQDADKSWMTRVVSAQSPMSTEISVSTSIVDPETGAQVDDRATKEAQNLLKAVQDAAPEEKVNILASYTSGANYQDIFNKTVNRLMEEQNISKAEATAQTQASMGNPGTDEHSTGLLINFGVNDTLDTNTVAASEAGQWLKDNAWRYGFIQRYPEGKENSTNHAADPTAYRFVGEENAQRIYTQNLSLEEFNALVAQEAQEAAQRAAEEEKQRQQEAQQAAQNQAAQ